MFRTKGDGKENAHYHREMILAVARIDVGAAIVLGAIYFEWAVKRTILALGKSPVSKLNDLYKNGEDGKRLNMSKLKDLWKHEVQGCFGVPTLSDCFDTKKDKKVFGCLKLTWRDLERARELRDNIVHGGRCSPQPKNGMDYVELEIAAAEALAELVVSKSGKSIFKPIRRK